MEKKVKENKGITLIALIVTIIVLLILAGVAIIAIFGNDGVIKKADRAKTSTDTANEEEQVKLAYVNSLLSGSTSLDYGVLYDELKKIDGMQGLPETREAATSSTSWASNGTLKGKNERVYTITQAGVNATGGIATGDTGDTDNFVYEEVEVESTSDLWDVEGDKIVKYKGTDTNVVVPCKVDGVAMKEIGRSVCSSLSQITDLKISKGIEIIDANAFEGKIKGGNLIIPSTVKNIGTNAFIANSSGGRLVISDNCEYIGEYAFAYSTYSGNLKLPSKIKRIEASAFQRTVGFRGTLIIPPSCEYLGGYAFATMGTDTFDGDLIIYGNNLEMCAWVFNGTNGFNGDIILTSRNKKDGTVCYGYERKS